MHPANKEQSLGPLGSTKGKPSNVTGQLVAGIVPDHFLAPLGWRRVKADGKMLFVRSTQEQFVLTLAQIWVAPGALLCAAEPLTLSFLRRHPRGSPTSCMGPSPW